MTTKSLSLPVREIATTRRQPRPTFTAPAVKVEEVQMAIQMICGMYPPLADHAEALEAFALAHRQDAYALVQMGWTMATVERELGDRQWFFSSWATPMKEYQAEGTAMGNEIPEGKPVRMSDGERDLIVEVVGPMFVSGDQATHVLKRLIPAAIIGKRGSHFRLSMKLIELVLGTEGYQQFEEQLKAARAEAASVPAPAPEADAEESEDTDAPDAASA